MDTIYFSKKFEARWSEVDPNMHLRHTVYADYTDQVRVSFFNEYGFSLAKLQEWQVGPILFATKSYFYREAYLYEILEVNFKLLYLSEDGRKWKVAHEIKKEDGTVASKVCLLGSWMDLEKRKVTAPPQGVRELFQRLEKSEDYSDTFSEDL